MSVMEAIKLGDFEFEPNEASLDDQEATLAMPGTRKKINELARRAAEGLPLWHPADCDDCEQGVLD